ncbi:Protein of unknown function [Rhizobium sp. NFR07]|uniref:DUF2934 domain-containing protein n=1 Tax=Rhizobium sp. NFR07 TaxID=1566262 RepID=UPI0008E1AF63|nr:DUF2934 domain-containing protein [Rhizobium sp. NFR07]SFB50867.1 Protein of unknown function [Rhizobium sp. NFR07]
MVVDREGWITKRAYELWEEAGRPDGYHEEHWVQATKEWEAGKAGAGEQSSSWDDEEY